MILDQAQTIATKSDLEQIVSKATFIWERLNDKRIEINVNTINIKEANTRLINWCKVVSSGNQEEYNKRLEWDGWNIERVREILGTELILNNQNLPSWTNTLAEIIHTASEFKLKKISLNPLITEDPYPFEDILLPLILVARQKLLKRLGSTSLSQEDLPLRILDESAYLSLERALLARLFNLTGKTLEFEFSHSRTLGQNLLNLVIDKAKSTSSQVRYHSFVEKLLSDGLLKFFQKYPVLGRLISITIDFWVEATSEFLERLNVDLPEIQLFFAQNTSSTLPINKVIAIKSSLSDLHNQNRSVICLTFESGFKLIYKPKNLGLEAIFCQLLEWCNQQLTSTDEQEFDYPNLTFKTLKVLNKKNYGWVEYIEQLPCADETAVKRFYTRAGMLLCLLYVLGATDCHNENLIACTEHLVLVDMETVMHHEAKLMESFLAKTATSAATNQLFDSVLTTGLLPMWQFNEDSSIANDFSGLGSVDVQPVPIPMPVWRNINTDNMYQGYEKIDRPVEANIPTLNGVPLSPNNYIDELVSGFEQMYRFLIRQREALLAPNSPLAAFASQEVRFIFRPTRIYGIALSKVMTPEFLRHGLDWSIQVDILSRSFLSNNNKPQAWPILSEELKAIGQLDVPYFSASAGSAHLTFGSKRSIAEYFQEPCLSQVLTRLQKLDETDLAQQIEIIQLAFYAREARTLQAETNSSVTEKLINSVPLILTPEQLERQAFDIASEIQQRAIRGTDGSLTWISLSYVPNAERFQLQPLGYSFYDGNCGIALFLAALTHCTEHTQFGDLALKAIQPLQKVLQTSDAQTIQNFALDMGIGGATGLGSIIYCLVKVSQFLDLPHLCEDAEQVAKLITPSTIALDRKYDIISGAAGAILGLLALEQKTENPEVLQRAIACGQHLLEYCHKAYTLKNVISKPLTGFSHGAAGIAYSLLRLYAVTQDSAYLDAARSAIAYENKFFYPTAGNWREIIPIYNPASPPVFWTTWCHGSPGIALGRLGGLSIYQTPEILHDIEVALQTTQKNAWQNIDQLCCGNLGRAEIMLVAAQKLNNPQWYESAQQLAAMTVRRAIQTGNYKLFDNLPKPVFSPCFFQGSTGIGYQLLRLAFPEALPSVLLWD